MEPKNTAVVVVDMQNCFAHEDGVLYSEASEEVIPSIRDFVDSIREKGIQVVYTKDTHTQEQFEELDNYDEFEDWGEHAVEGTWGHEIVEELDISDEDEVVEKGTYDAFHETDINDILEGIDNLIIVGTLANVCVLHTASSAALNDYNVTVVEDLVGYISESDKEYALEHIDFLVGEVESSEEILSDIL
jgi:nicotinamidase-related amidase